MSSRPPPLRLHGVHHTAFPTVKPRETIEFYRDILGLPVLHAITAKGWGWKGGYPDFFHFFFEAGRGSTIAFFYHVGTHELHRPPNPLGYQGQARHTAWNVETGEELDAWHELLTSRGVKVTPRVRHELLESVYFLDPNEYPLEVTLPAREFVALDAVDADMSLRAIAETFANAGAPSAPPRGIEDMWRLKADHVRSRYGFDAERRCCPAIFVPIVPEYRPLIDWGKSAADVRLTPVGPDYTCLSHPGQLVLRREQVPLIDALWFSMFVGGITGRITEYSEHTARIAP